MSLVNMNVDIPGAERLVKERERQSFMKWFAIYAVVVTTSVIGLGIWLARTWLGP